MVEIFREVRRVLRKDGTLWLNLGDSYAGSWGNYGGQNRGNGSQREIVSGSKAHQKSYDGLEQWRPPTTDVSGLKPKDLVGIPWRVAFALQADGWYLRSDIIWSKPNPMPESVTDRPTKAHEYLFLFSKAPQYFYDAEAIKEKAEMTPQNRFTSGEDWKNGGGPHRRPDGATNPTNRNKRSVWTVATAPYPEAHFATYPPDLIKPCIMAGTSARGCCAKCGAPWERILEREVISVSDSPRYSGVTMRNDANDGRTERSSKTLGWQPTCECGYGISADTFGVYEEKLIPCTVLDPFAGSGTTGAVALELGRKAILIELNPKYIELIRQRCDVTLGLALA
jgi:DNA modification methylase